MATKKRTKRKVRRQKLSAKWGQMRQVNFDPKTGAKLKGFHVMTPTGLIIKVPKHMLKG